MSDDIKERPDIMNLVSAAGFGETHFLAQELSAVFFSENESSLLNPERASIISAIV